MRTTIAPVSLGLLLAASFVACGDPAKPDQPSPSAQPAAVSAQPSASVATTASAAPSATDSAAPPSEGSAAASAASSSGKPATNASAAANATASPVASAKTDTGEVKGEEKTGAAFSAYMTGSKTYKSGQPGTVTAIVNALGDYHVNPEFPYKIKLDAAPSGVAYASDTVRDVSRSEKRATMSVPFTPSQAGSATISGTISLSVCTKEQCVIEKAPVSVTVKVE